MGSWSPRGRENLVIRKREEQVENEIGPDGRRKRGSALGEGTLDEANATNAQAHIVNVHCKDLERK